MHNEILTRLLSLFPSDSDMELPPKVFVDMEGDFIEFENERLVARFPNKDRYRNPFGCMQGGIIVAAMDNTMSPLSYVVGPPNLTREITATFKRPISERDRFIDVIATVLKKTTEGIVLRAEVLNESGKLAAIGVANCVFISKVQ